MSVDTRKTVIDLLETYSEREQQISLLHYELEHPTHMSKEGMITAMALSHGDGGSPPNGHISDKTLYIALNYQEKIDKLYADTNKEIVEQLVELEQEQRRLEYYVSILEERQAVVIKFTYFLRYSQDKVAQELKIVPRTVRRLRNEAIDKLTEMYSFAEGFMN